MNKAVIFLALLLVLVAGLTGCKASSSQPLPKSMKGYELYSWQASGKWHFTLITGTNRDKKLEEITTGKDQLTGDGWVDLHTDNVNELKNIIARVPAGTFVIWVDGHFVMRPDNTAFTFDKPPQEIVNEIKDIAVQHGVDFNTY